MTLKVLIDHSVRERAVQGETGFVPQEGELLGQKISYLQVQTRYTPKRTDWLQPEIDVLPEIAQLVRSKRIQAFTTFELEAEAFRVARIGDPHPIDPFRDCTIEVLPDPFHRSKFGLDGEQHMSKDNVIDHCKRLLNLTEENAVRLIKMFDRNPRYNLSQFEKKCLQNLTNFQQLCHGIHESHYPDALHLWTAEENKMDAFLTLDRKFKNVVDRQDVKFGCRPLYPSEFLALL